jgi:hypothetical protein
MSYDSGTPLPVENPERFYRSGENRKGLIAAEQSVSERVTRFLYTP